MIDNYPLILQTCFIFSRKQRILKYREIDVTDIQSKAFIINEYEHGGNVFICSGFKQPLLSDNILDIIL